MPQNALIDVGTKALLTLHPLITSIIFLEQIMPDTHAIPMANEPNYLRTSWFHRHAASPFNIIRPEDYPTWTWAPAERIFIATRPDVVSESLRARSRLATAKAAAITQVVQDISFLRIQQWNGVMFQDTIYLAKRLQAQACKDAEYDETSATEWPYVAQYAEYIKTSLRVAADEILLKSSFQDEVFSRSENLRIIFFNAIKEAQDPLALPGIAEEARRRCHDNALT